MLEIQKSSCKFEKKGGQEIKIGKNRLYSAEGRRLTGQSNFFPQ